MDIDFSILKTIEPLPNEEYTAQELIKIDEELSQLNKEITEINIDTIPFDKTDAVIVFSAAIIECLLDFFFSDPANENSFANKCNNSNNPIGKFFNNIHEKIDHKGNPLDFQGRFDENGNPILHGAEYDGPIISFAGGDHRVRTNGHDLLRFISGIKQYRDGKFSDYGYIDGVKVFVESSVNQYGTEYVKLSTQEAVIKYAVHMFADFFSSKGLQVPGWSCLSHASNREIRQLASEIYNEGLNLRTILLQGVTIGLPEIIVRITSYLRYKDTQWSKEARKKKTHLLLLMTHGIATCVNLGKVIITENPVSINIPLISRSVKLSWKCIRDQIKLNERAITKLDLTTYRISLEGERTLLLIKDGIYYTSQYQDLFEKLIKECNRYIDEHLEHIREIERLNAEYQNLSEYLLLRNSTPEILESSFLNNIQIYENRSLAEYSSIQFDSDININNTNLEQLNIDIEL